MRKTGRTCWHHSHLRIVLRAVSSSANEKDWLASTHHPSHHIQTLTFKRFCCWSDPHTSYQLLPSLPTMMSSEPVSPTPSTPTTPKSNMQHIMTAEFTAPPPPHQSLFDDRISFGSVSGGNLFLPGLKSPRCNHSTFRLQPRRKTTNSDDLLLG